MYKKLNHQQKLAIEHVGGPALVLAVPGAGKTTVIIHRTANLILNHKIKPEKILSITFSRASANDIKKRFNDTYRNVSSTYVKFSTIHSFSYHLISEYAYRNNLKLTLIEDERKSVSKKKLLRKIYYNINKDYITEERLNDIINSIGYIKNMMLSIEDFLTMSNTEVENFEKIFYSYEKYKKEHLLIDFDDMLTLSLDFLQKDRYLLGKYRAKYDFIQIDEGQDTSKIQMQIIKTICHPKNNLFIVADDDQSIYGFRGAFPKGLFELKKTYPNTKIFFMEQNYRSSNDIVSICNQFIKRNTLRYNKNIFTNNDTFKPINIVNVENVLDQYDYLVNQLLKHKYYKNTAILYRNNISAIGIVEYLEKNNIPFYMRDSKIKFFSHWIVKDILNFWTLSYDDTNIEIFEKIYYKMRGYIRKDYINFVKTLNYNESVFDRMMKYPGLKKEYKQKTKELKIDFIRLSKLKPYDAIQFIEKNLEYERYLRENSLKFGYTYDSLKTILFNLKMIALNTRNLRDFIDRLKYLEYLTLHSKKMNEGVILSTIHSAKGLEFENVYMVDLIDGDFPMSNCIEDFEKGNIEVLEEERRLFYVGMTRAKKVLELITINYKNGKKVESSRFVKELESLDLNPFL